MLVWGGFGGFTNTGAQYDPATDTWTAITVTGAPSAGSAVWTGSHMLVWGGYDSANAGLTNTGALYDAATDTWKPITTAAAPSARTSHTAVWTGSRMLVWGGESASGLTTNAGGRYVRLDAFVKN